MLDLFCGKTDVRASELPRKERGNSDFSETKRIESLNKLAGLLNELANWLNELAISSNELRNSRIRSGFREAAPRVRP